MSAPRRVLVVDDEIGIIMALRRALGRAGYAVTTCNRAEEALALLETQPFDIIISDQCMPGMVGTELLKAVRDAYPHMLRLMLTGTPDLAVAVDAMGAGNVHRCVSKPWNNAELCETLEQLAA